MNANVDRGRRTAAGSGGAEARGRALGIVSAVLLLVLLATSGLPAEARCARDLDQVTACESTGAVAAARAAERAELQLCAGNGAATRARPRPLQRQRRVDCRGLPPPRAPTA